MSKTGKLIAIEGTDACGKETQSILLRDYYLNKGYTENNLTRVAFPQYGSSSATMVEKYLHGEFSKNGTPEEVDPYTASLFYSIDRSISFRNDYWGDVYRSGGIVISDRYTISNVIHQSSKLPIFSMDKDPYIIGVEQMFIDYVHWLTDLEYNRLKIPVPDITIVLVNNEECYEKLIKSRNQEQDIHEKNIEYQKKCIKTIKAYQYYCNYVNYIDMGETYFVHIYDKNNDVRNIDDIHNEIIHLVE